MQLCDYGCGREAKYQFKNGKWCCGSNVSHCPAVKNKIGNIFKGKILNKNHRLNISKGKKGKKQTEEHIRKRSEILKGNIPWNKDKKNVYNKTTIKLMSDLKKGNNNPCWKKQPWNKGLLGYKAGENHWNWQGGKSFEEYCPIFKDNEWRDFIYSRDKYTCQNCGCTKQLSYKVFSCNLHIHHIDHDKQNCHPNNCITLCLRCNSKANFHRWMWKFIYQDLTGCFN